MKKLFLMLLVMFSGVCSMYVNGSENTTFEEYVELTRNNPGNPPAMTVVSDSKYRIIYIGMNIDATKAAVTPRVAGMKRAMLSEVRKLTEDCKLIKRLKINMVYTFVTRDKEVVIIPLSYKEL